MQRILICLLSILCLSASRAGAQDTSLATRLDLDDARALTVQHNQTLKTLDTYARQAVSAIYGRSKIDGQDPVFTVLDIINRPGEWADQPILKVANAPLRVSLASVLEQSQPEVAAALRDHGRLTWNQWRSAEVQTYLVQAQSKSSFKAEAIGQLVSAATVLEQLRNGRALPNIGFVPPTDAGDRTWLSIDEGLTSTGKYDATMLANLAGARIAFHQAWERGDADNAAAELGKLTTALPAINTAVYPSSLKRNAEVVYNRLAKLTLPAAMLYMVAFVLLMMSSRTGWTGLRLWGLRLLVVSLIVHTVGIAVRWWLTEKSTGDWFHSIPIKNMFESVLMSAWFGVTIGLLLELRRGRGLFGAAGAFVGWLSLLAIFAAPYVFGKEIGGELAPSQGILMSYWLYIHVTVVTASYALIGMGFLLSVWWLVKYYRTDQNLDTRPRQISADAVRDDDYYLPGDFGGGGAIGLGFWRTLSAVLFFRGSAGSPPGASTAAHSHGLGSRVTENAESSRDFLARLDQCNLVVLQLAFWMLGVGIVFGAIWADMSWGRPWGWDPKETFALVTWIVYLIVVHVRVATPHKAWWTAVLAAIGFFIMLFNWIGVNFFLVGLHSYA